MDAIVVEDLRKRYGEVQALDGVSFSVREGEVLYRGAHFSWVRWGRVVEENVLPDTQAVARLAPPDAQADK